MDGQRANGGIFGEPTASQPSLEAVGVPGGPINRLDQVFADPQVRHREMQIRMPHPLSADGMVDLIGNPIKYSATPGDYELRLIAHGTEGGAPTTRILRLTIK